MYHNLCYAFAAELVYRYVLMSFYMQD